MTMTLILLLLVLVTERVALQGTRWQVESYLSGYTKRYQSRLAGNEQEVIAILLFVAAPAVVVGVILYVVDLGLISFLVNLLVLAVVIGNPAVRAYYRQYLNAESRGDLEAMSLLQQKFSVLTPQDKTVQVRPDVTDSTLKTASDGEPIDTPDSSYDEIELDAQTRSLSESLIWCNFKYYAVPIFYFVLFGAPGVLFYAAVIYLLDSESFCQSVNKSVTKTLSKWAEWLYWLPARFVSIGFMFVGNFSNGLEAYLRLAANFTVSGFDIVVKVAHAADDISLSDSNEITDKSNINAKKMVKLAKRNMALFIVVVALLTLYGYVV